MSPSTRLAEGNAARAIPWPCVHELLATVIHPKVEPPRRISDFGDRDR